MLHSGGRRLSGLKTNDVYEQQDLLKPSKWYTLNPFIEVGRDKKQFRSSAPIWELLAFAWVRSISRVKPSSVLRDQGVEKQTILAIKSSCLNNEMFTWSKVISLKQKKTLKLSTLSDNVWLFGFNIKINWKIL